MAQTQVRKRLRAIPLEVGSRRWVVENEDEGTSYKVDAEKGECFCPHWQFRLRHKREDCAHLKEVRTVIERQRYWRNEGMQITAARAHTEVTGEPTVPEIAGMSQDELRVVFA